MKVIPSTIPYHGPNTTHLVLMSVLGHHVQVYGLFAEGVTSSHLIILVTVWLD